MLELEGCIVTIDAMGTQTEIAEKIVERKADYILALKGNRPSLLEDVRLYMDDYICTPRHPGNPMVCL
jgi:predicted transposase YbfD/YdcC